MNNTIKSILLALSVLTAPMSVFAAEGAKKVPQQAIDACASKAIGDSCSFTGRKNNTLEGTCRESRRMPGKTVCMPKPPQQAFDACNGKAEGDACTFTGRRDNTVNGNCKKSKHTEGKMICKPAKMLRDGAKPAEKTAPAQ